MSVQEEHLPADPLHELYRRISVGQTSNKAYDARKVLVVQEGFARFMCSAWPKLTDGVGERTPKGEAAHDADDDIIRIAISRECLPSKRDNSYPRLIRYPNVLFASSAKLQAALAVAVGRGHTAAFSTIKASDLATVLSTEVLAALHDDVLVITTLCGDSRSLKGWLGTGGGAQDKLAALSCEARRVVCLALLQQLGGFPPRRSYASCGASLRD